MSLSPAEKFNAEAGEALRACEAALATLAAAYERGIRRLGAEARRGLLRAAPVSVVADASWHAPDLDELFTIPDGAKILEGATRAARAGMVANATGPWYDALDATIRNRITGEIEQLLGARITEVTGSVRHEAGLLVRKALDDGKSVDDAASALRTGFSEFAGSRGMLIARTEMIGAANAASLGVARETGVVATKVWLATQDARTRPDHADADGQAVGINDPFIVGGFEMDHPGDESAPAEEVCNCRCTLTYEEEARVSGITAAASGSTTLPLSERTRAWDAGAAKQRVKTWATSGGKLDLDKASGAFFWRPDGDHNWSDFKLPFADVIGGELTAVWDGVTGAAGAIQGSRGGVDIPAADEAGVKTRIGSYYDKAEKAYDDDTIEPPWETPEEEKSEDASVVRAAAAEELPGRIDVLGMMQFVTTPAVDGSEAATAWQAILAPIGLPTSDGRILDPAEDGAITWRTLPLPMMWQDETAPGHDGAQIAGRIDEILVEQVTVGDWTGYAFVGRGVFDDAADAPADAPGREAARLARNGTLNGVSVDFAATEWEMRTAENEPIAEDDDEAWLEAFFGGGLMAVIRGELMGATITPFPAFAEASVVVVASLEHAWALGVAASARSLIQTIRVGTNPEYAVEEPEPVVAAGVFSLETLAALGAAIAMGLCTLNEARARVGLGPVHGGDELGALLPERPADTDAPLQAALSVVAQQLDDRAASLAVVASAGDALERARATLADTLARMEDTLKAPPPRRRIAVVRDADGLPLSYEEEAV